LILSTKTEKMMNKLYLHLLRN